MRFLQNEGVPRPTRGSFDVDQNQPPERQTQKRCRLPSIAEKEEEEDTQDVTDVQGPSTGLPLLTYRPRAKMAKTRADELLEITIKKYTGQERTFLDPTFELLRGI